MACTYLLYFSTRGKPKDDGPHTYLARMPRGGETSQDFFWCVSDAQNIFGVSFGFILWDEMCGDV